MTGGSAVHLAELNATMRYADVVAARVQQMEGELAAIDTTLRDGPTNSPRLRALAANRSRIDLWRAHRALHVELDRQATDAEDDEAETALNAFASADRHPRQSPLKTPGNEHATQLN